MQRLGTEWGRDMIGGSLWVAAWQRRVKAVRTSRIVVDDCRFPNELAAAREMGFVPVRLYREERTHWGERHVSEYALDEVWMPEFRNDGALEALALNILGL